MRDNKIGKMSYGAVGLVAGFVLLAFAGTPTNATNICQGGVDCPATLVEAETVPNNTVADLFSFTGTAGVSYTILADTVAAGTAFDPWMRVCRDVGPIVGVPPRLGLTNCFALPDDSFGCTFPPPSYSCPRATGVLPADSDGIYYVGVAAHPCCGGSMAGTVGEYELRITLGSYNAVTVTQNIADDRPGNLP